MSSSDYLKKVFYWKIINEKFKGGYNYIHLLVNNLTQENYPDVSQMIKTMLEHGCSATSPNDQHETPFYLLLKNPVVEIDLINVFIAYTRIDTYSYRADEITTLIEERGLKPNVIAKIDSTFEFAFQHLDEWDQSMFEEKLAILRKSSQSFKHDMVILLEEAVVKNLSDFVSVLMAHGVDTNEISANSNLQLTPAFLACTLGHHQVLKALLNDPKLLFASIKLRRNRSVTLLHQIFNFNLIDAEDRQKCFELIIADKRCSSEIVNKADGFKNVPLHYSCKLGCNEISKELLRRGAYIGHDSVINFIQKDVLEEFLDDRIKCSGYINDQDFDVSFDYKFLTPTDKTKLEISAAHLLSTNSTLRNLILHPVISSFVLIKWKKINFMVYMNMLIYLSFLLFLGFTIINYYNVFDEYNPECNDTSIETFKSNFRTYLSDYWALTYISLSGLLLMTFYELVQLKMSWKKYFLKPINWLDILLIGFSLNVLVGQIGITRGNFGQICSIMILLMGAQCIQLFSKVSVFSLSLHLAILGKVSKTFLKTIAPYLIIMLAFGMGFYALNFQSKAEKKRLAKSSTLNNSTNSTSLIPDGFSSTFLATISTVRMMLSDFSAVTVQKHDYFKGTLLLGFIFAISIIVFNLLNALAISDTNNMMEVAELVETERKISTLRTYDALFSRFNLISFNMFPKISTIMLSPNRHNTIQIKNKNVLSKKVVIDVHEITDESKFQNLVNLHYYLFWMTVPYPEEFDDKVIKKILDYVKNQQSKRFDEIVKKKSSQELCALGTALKSLQIDINFLRNSLSVSQSIVEEDDKRNSHF